MALWSGRRLLVVRSSYRAMLDLPGGGAGRAEPAVTAALRELREETGIALEPAELEQPGTRLRYRFEHRLIEADVFSARIDVLPTVRIDGGEIVWAGWLDRAELAVAELSPTLAGYLAQAGSADDPAHSR